MSSCHRWDNARSSHASDCFATCLPGANWLATKPTYCETFLGSRPAEKMSRRSLLHGWRMSEQNMRRCAHCRRHCSRAQRGSIRCARISPTAWTCGFFMTAIAKGDVLVNHWLALGRPYTSLSGQVLLSWSGTMFEYLMPLLFTRSYRNSLLDNACAAAVDRQIDYARERGVPWGISESAYSALDVHKIYQYRAFGVPSLGLKRGLEDDLVVAPYASALALLVYPEDSIKNLKRLVNAGM